MSAPLAEVDPDIAELLGKELGRQRDTLEMIASENFVPRAVLQAQGSVLTNKYAEGLPGRRYYGGCEYVDVVENIARDRAKALFGADFANVQPHSGAQANAAVLAALMSPGERLLGLDLANGGHLTHGMKLNFSGKLYENGFYGVDPTTHLIDMDVVRSQALEFRPKVIIAGWSAYPRTLDFEAFRSIADEVDAKLWVDMAHFAGLVAVGLHPSPVPHADVVSTTIHKTLGGGRSGMILGKQEYAKAINSAVFPGQQGGPLMHVIAGKAVALKIASTPEFADRQQRTLSGARILADRLLADDVAKAGVSVVSKGTDVHLVLVDLRDSPLDGQAAEDLLHEVGITVNRNAVPNDPRPPMVTSGLRIGTPGAGHPRLRGRRVHRGCRRHRDRARRRQLRRRVRAACPGDPAGQGVPAVRGPRGLEPCQSLTRRAGAKAPDTPGVRVLLRLLAPLGPRHGARQFQPPVSTGYSNCMAQKPVAGPLTLELEPVCEANMDRHLNTEDIWFAHDYVPFERGENFAFLGGRDWDPSQMTLPRTITDACEILLLLKDNLSAHHRELVEHFILEEWWGRWLGRWTAEEHLHAIALREYLVVTREVDPTANEEARVQYVMKGYRGDMYTQVETLVYMAFTERTHAVYCANLAAMIEEPILAGLVDRIRRDEERHELFWANLVAHCLEYTRDETIAAIAARAADLQVVGADIDTYHDKVQNVAEAGIFGPAELRQAISDRITAWGVADEPQLRKFVTG